MAPLTTILTVNYNTRRFIELCLKSIFLHTNTPYQVIVIDNGSTDGSLEFLAKLERAKKIKVIPRRAQFAASEHGKALDFALYKYRIRTPLVCTIDSDAYVAKKGWLAELNKQRKGHFAVGYEHFRDPHYLHPACMLMEYKKLLMIGQPSFALTKKNGQFFDTGVIVSQTALRRGEKLVGGRGLESMVPHRWCATRIQKVGKDEKLDGQFTRDEFAAVNAQWFSRPDVVKIMSIKYT